MKTNIICLTPVKNEEWILERFLKSTSLWADHIIIADQGSTDRSREICGRFPKVILISNNKSNYDELARQKLLIEEARKIEGKKLLIALDADEFFQNPDIKSACWQTMLNATDGTVFRFNWMHISPNFKKSIIADFKFPWGFMDDGSDHVGRVIHSPRIPIPEYSKNIEILDNLVMHYGFVSKERVESKYRWYLVFEFLKGHEHVARLNSKYFSSKVFENASNFDKNLLKVYSDNGIDMFSIQYDLINSTIHSGKLSTWSMQQVFWWDKEILDLIIQHGSKRFKRVDIWAINWRLVAENLGYDNLNQFNDPRNAIDKIISKLNRIIFARNSRLFRVFQTIFIKLIKT